MSRSGPIIIVDDDLDDHEMIEKVLFSMKVENPRKRFFEGESVLSYLHSTTDKPFIIICDINMPLMNGLQLKENIDKDEALRKRSIPFVLLSTTANSQQVRKAYELTVQGFFLKGTSYEGLKKSIQQIIEYWRTCVHINNI